MVSCTFGYCFLYLMYLFMIDLCNTLLAEDRVHAIPAKIGKKIKPVTVFDRDIPVDVAPILAIESFDF